MWFFRHAAVGLGQDTLGGATAEGLKLGYDEICRERDRLRAARASFIQHLVPVSAGITVGIVSAFSTKGAHGHWLWLAFVTLAVMVVVSLWYGGMPAYRHLRALKEPDWRRGLSSRYPQLAQAAADANLNVEDLLPEREWYMAMIDLERRIYGGFTSSRNRHGTPWFSLQGGRPKACHDADDRERTGVVIVRGRPKDLQDALDRERTGVVVVQVLFVLLILFLVMSQLIR